MKMTKRNHKLAGGCVTEASTLPHVTVSQIFLFFRSCQAQLQPVLDNSETKNNFDQRFVIKAGFSPKHFKNKNKIYKTVSEKV